MRISLQVYKGRWNGVLVAVKVLNTAAAEVLEDFHRECAILERLRHPNIIKYFGTASNAEGQVSTHPGFTPPDAIDITALWCHICHALSECMQSAAEAWSATISLDVSSHVSGVAGRKSQQCNVSPRPVSQGCWPHH